MWQDASAHTIHLDGVALPADLVMPPHPRGVVVFVHGSGSSRLSPRNRAVAEAIRTGGAFGTLLFDLLTAAEDRVYTARFDTELLTSRLVGAVQWLQGRPECAGLPVGLFGASTGAAAALAGAVQLGAGIKAIVSRGGRPDLASAALPLVTAPTLLIVGGRDDVVIELNREALRLLGSEEKRLELVAGATHLFEEPGALDEVVRLTSQWFSRYL